MIAKNILEIIRTTLSYNNKLRTRNKKQLVINFFVGLSNILKLRKMNYLFFNNSDKRILIEDKYYDIFFDAWADKLGQDKSLFIEWAINKHYSKNEIHSKNRISDLLFKLIIMHISCFTKPNIEDENVLSKIKEEYGLNSNFNKEIKTKKAEIVFYLWFFKLVRPKGVFVLSSFTKVSIVIAAKELGIKVFEAQHGYIGDSHPFEFSYPDVLFSFGNYEKTCANSNLIFRNKQIIPIGNFQLERIKKQETPKNKEIDYSKHTNVDNIIELPDYTIYDVLKGSDYNITIFSTTAIEGVFLGVKPIFYNIKNLLKKHFNTDKMSALVIEEGALIPANLLELMTKDQEPYFIEDYNLNVIKANLCF